LEQIPVQGTIAKKEGEREGKEKKLTAGGAFYLSLREDHRRRLRSFGKKQGKEGI